MYQDKLILESFNKSKKIWDLIKNESGHLERGCNPIKIQNNGKLISEPTQVAKLFNLYFIEIAESYSVISTPRQINTQLLKALSLNTFYTH